MHWAVAFPVQGLQYLCLSKDQATALKVEQVMKEVYERIGIDYHTYVTTINKKGVKVV